MALSSVLFSRKFKHLARRLKSDALALGHLEFLWQTGYQAADDVLGESDDVEEAARWRGKRGVLTAALVECGFLDYTDNLYRIHDFWDHAPQYVDRKRKRRENQRLANGEPEASQRLAVPNLVQPNPPVPSQPPTQEPVCVPPAGGNGEIQHEQIQAIWEGWREAAETVRAPMALEATWKERLKIGELLKAYPDTSLAALKPAMLAFWQDTKVSHNLGMFKSRLPDLLATARKEADAAASYHDWLHGPRAAS